MEAGEARALLRRLGEEAFGSNLAVRHRHITETQHHSASPSLNNPETRTFTTHHVLDDVNLNWGGLLSVIFQAPKFVLGVLAVFAIIAWEFVGPLLLLAVILPVVMLGPGRALLNRSQRDRANSFITAVNAWITEQGG
jgi:hypothetical protein